MAEIEKQIIEVLDKIKPFLQKDGGDLEYIGFDDGIVKIRMHGACAGCAFIDDTISNGVEMLLQEEVPGVVKVQVVE